MPSTRARRTTNRLLSLLTGCLLLGTGGTLPAPAADRARADAPTVSVDDLRTGWDRDEPGLAPSEVSSSDFGRQFSTAVDGQVYAQPLVAGRTVVAATENAKVYGLDSASGTINWTKDLGAPWPASAIGCGDLVPNFGVTSTPVYDPATKTVYLTAKINDGADTQHPNWYVHALDATTGTERAGWPVKVQGAPVNDPSHPFNAFTAAQRPGLLLMGGSVYAAFASHCDVGPYVGYVLGVNTTSRATTLWATEDSSANGMAGIWMSGGGLVSDGPGRMFLSTGNGISPAPGPGSQPPGRLAESVVRLGVNSDGTMSAQDFFSPSNAPTLDTNDTDLGSGGPTALPGPAFGTAQHPRLLVEIGKDGRLFLLDRDNLGGRSQGPGGTDGVLGTFGPYEGVWGHPAAYGGEGGYVYTIGSKGPLRAFAYGTNGAGLPTLTNTGTSTGTFGYTSGSPVVTSTGTTPGSALVWAVYSDGSNGANGQLRAYDAVPVKGTLNLRYSAPIGTVSKFSVPATDGGRVYVGTRDGHVLGFGRPSTGALTGGPVDFGKVAVGGTGQGTAKVTATEDVTISAVAAAPGGQFSAAPTGLPVTLHEGDSYTVPVSFSPTSPGGDSSVLTVTTDTGAVGLGLTGYGTRPGLTAFPSELAFGTVATGTVKTLGVSFTNTGTEAETVSASTSPDAPFGVDGLPADGALVQPQQSVTVQVRYAPTAAGEHSGTLSVTGTNGTAAVRLTGGAVVGEARLTVTPTSTGFGSVAVGKSVTKTFDISNTGNIPLTVTKAAPPAAPFQVTNPLSEGQVIGPEDVIHQAVTFSPTAVGAASGTYQLTSDDGRGPQNESLTGTGTAPGRVTVPAPGDGGWKLNGSALLSGADLQLTRTAAHQAGSAVFPVPVVTDGLKAAFSTVIGGGSGGDGLTFGLLDPAGATPTALGTDGGGLGWAGKPGVAITFDTYRNTGEPSANFVGITAATSNGALTYAATTTSVPNLRSGPHTVSVSVSGKTLTVSMDGIRLLNTTVNSLPPTALLAFTGANGDKTDIHSVRDAVITATSYAVPPPGPNRWTYNGSAALSGTDLVLTQAVQSARGSAVQGTAVPSARLKATFTAAIGGGSGADGLALLLLDAAKATPTALGAGGGGLGYAGLPGIAVTLDTHRNTGDPSANFVGVAVGGTGSPFTYAATSTAVPALRTGTHVVDVTVTTAGHVLVAVDGTQVIDTAVALPQNVLVGFAAATGSTTDNHTVRGVKITY
ncbi:MULTISPECIES: choice-of-anchor D domain-containing protein [unclassified Streptomyces]|uniref:choice-of-anchor D domain-containing protein n=1 Tax=unclassified Streptomyces TaxID=2593676 RepID=UPI002251A0FE|nr:MULTISPECIES: choice-of-anchor D domain-containing protein [unclassified Streptomyces]MCX4987412.1 choice-of-anchor D domain-containing protein [Streptomyces sp. NBC_00568]MCX5007455.1 choice-of-anchor D domain-containing protein [Streptomyces sp. NBC_00638]